MKIDVSIVSFVLVLVIAIPVTTLRSQTYSVGYEIAELKAKERELRERHLKLTAERAEIEAMLLARPPAVSSLEEPWAYPELQRVNLID